MNLASGAAVQIALECFGISLEASNAKDFIALIEEDGSRGLHLESNSIGEAKCWQLLCCVAVLSGSACPEQGNDLATRLRPIRADTELTIDDDIYLTGPGRGY